MYNETIDFEQVAAKGCGLDVHKETFVATVSGTGIKKGNENVFYIYALFERIERMDFILRGYPCSHGKYWDLLETSVQYFGGFRFDYFNCQCPSYQVCSGS